jgi:hypothetical protein
MRIVSAGQSKEDEEIEESLVYAMLRVVVDFDKFEKGNFDILEKENFDILEKEILTVWKRKFWQFGKENFDSLKKKILTV